MQIRAVDTGLPLIRSANNGISAAVDSRGRVVDAFALNVRGSLDVTVAIPTRTPPLLGAPRRNGLLVIALLAWSGSA